MEERKLLILYGSQTGTAQEVAENLWRDSKRFYFQGPILCMDDYPVSQLIAESLVLFVCSTTGDGSEPDNMKKFWKFLLRKNLPLTSLQGLRFAVLGLGDSSYAKFNFAAKKLYRRLLQLGGQSLLDVGLADDQHDLGADAVIDKWRESVWKILCEIYPLPSGQEPIGENVLFPPRWNVNTELEIENGENSVHELYLKDKNVDTFSEVTPRFFTLKDNIRTTSENHFQDVRLLKFHNPKIVYAPGDVFQVYPQNSEANVKRFFEVVSEAPGKKLSPSWVVHISEKSSDAPVPQVLKHPLTLLTCVKQYWDLNMTPHRYFFRLLSHFTTSDLEREKLLELVSSEGQQDLFNYCNRPRRTVIEVLEDFSSAASNIPLEYLFELLRPIRPRAFSIASSPERHKEELHILVAVVKYQTKLVVPRHGLCSNWLASLTEEQSVPGRVQKGTFNFPATLETPVIMIGPGTGVAPFRSFIHEKVAKKQARADLLYLFFGCRKHKHDFHLEEEWLALQDSKCLTMFCAFSRDQESKEYVQHVMQKQASLLWLLLSTKHAVVYIAGRSDGLPSAVKDVFIKDIACGCGNLSPEEADAWFTKLQGSGRQKQASID